MLLNRRSFTLGGGGVLIFPTVARAEGVDQAAPPLQFGNADFAGAWTPDFPIAELVAAAPPIKKGIAELLGANVFKSLDEIDRFFSPHTGGTSFLAWFNSKIANKGQWKGRSASGPDLEANFESYWSHATSIRPYSAMEFITYMSVFTNECGGNLATQSEKFGRPPDHPGISYLFDAFGMTYPNGKSWHKKSYNAAPNLTVFQSLADPIFQKAHPDQRQPATPPLYGTGEKVWAETKYPKDRFETKADPNKLGPLLDTDFFKFRGRGLIQTTWRDNYRMLAEFVKGYQGPNKILAKYAKAWAHLDLDVACTTSTSENWDEIFGDPEKIVLFYAVNKHAIDKQYLPLSTTTTGINGTELGSIERFGNRLGGDGYGPVLKARVGEICNALSLV